MPEPQVSVRMSAGPVLGRSGRLIKDTTDLEQVAAVSSRQRDNQRRLSDATLYKKIGTLSVNCNTWFFLIKTIRGL